jgi:hypothetical protein
MNDPQIAIQLHWIAQAIYKLAEAVIIGAAFVLFGLLTLD